MHFALSFVDAVIAPCPISFFFAVFVVADFVALFFAWAMIPPSRDLVMSCCFISRGHYCFDQ